MSSAKPRHLLHLEYEAAAEAYLRSLPPEHFMEATPQSTQRKITVASMDYVQVRRPDIQTFSELLVQYPLPGRPRPHQVVPDNLVVVWPEPIRAGTSFNLPLQPTRPFWVLEYVSKGSMRKDYETNFLKYERDLGVPYYLTFYPDNQEMTLYKLRRKRYASVKPNEHGRLAVPELELEIALVDGWVRFWFRGELLPLSGELLLELDETRRQLEQATRQAKKEHQRAEREKQRADAEKERADAEALQTAEQAQRADRAEQEVARLTALLEQLKTRPGS